MPTNAPVRPFAGLLTPETLKARRAAENEAAYADQSFWVKRAAKYGEDLRESMRSIGYGLNEEDAKAAAHATLLQSVMGDAKTLIDAGELTPDEAQGYVMQQSMTALMNAGDYEAAAEIAPQLTEWQKGRLELGKIKSEIDENAADRFKSLATGQKDVLMAKLAKDMSPYEIESEKALAEQRRAAAALDNRTDPNLRSGGKGGDGGDEKVGAIEQRAFRQLAVNSSGLFRRMTELGALVLDNPGVGSDASETIARLQDQVKGATKLAQAETDSATWLLNEQTKDTVKGTLDAGFARLPINMARASYDSLVMDVAYALAKAKDSGGRLSDADVNNAVRIIGAAGDPQAMSKVLSEVVDRTYKDVYGWKSAGKWYKDQTELYGEVDKSYNEFKGMLEARSATPPKGEAGKAKPMTAAQRAAIYARAKAVRDQHKGR